MTDSVFKALTQARDIFVLERLLGCAIAEIAGFRKALPTLPFSFSAFLSRSL